MGKETKINPVKDRTKGIGGSDAAAVLGVSPWTSPLKLYKQKVGAIEPIDDIVEKLEPNVFRTDSLQCGNELEDKCAEYFTKLTGIKTRKSNQRHYHKEYKFMNANVDRFIVGEPAGLEIKTTCEYNKYKYKDSIDPKLQIPLEYYCQVQHYMAVTGYDKWYFYVRIGSATSWWTIINRDNDFIENELIPKCKEFWIDYFLARKEPPVTSLDHDLIDPYGSEKTETLLNLESKEHINQFLLYKKLESEVKEKINLHKAHIKKALLDREGNFACTEKAKITYKTQERSTVDTQKLKKEYPDVYQNCKKVSKTDVLNVKELKK